MSRTDSRQTEPAHGRSVTRREAVNAARRFRLNYDGSRQVVRFSFGQRVEHLVLTVSVVVLAVTGLAQSYYSSTAGIWLLRAMGGIDSARQVHRSFAFLLAALVVYHLVRFLDQLFVHSQPGKIWFERADLRDFVQTLKLDLGLAKSAPRFDRYNFEQKTDYWALVLGLLVIGLSGLIQLFPLFFTRFVPGWVIPAARLIHHWQAILIVLGVATWHLYHTVLKKFNPSIFGGTLSMEEMQAEHPLELIYLERAAAVVNSTEWPVHIDLPTEEQPPVQVQGEAAPAAEPASAEEPETEPVVKEPAVPAQGVALSASGENQA